jgi:hypothetical protein
MFSEVFHIPVSELGTSKYNTHVSVDLVSHGHCSIFVPNARVIRQKEYRDSFPFVLVILAFGLFASIANGPGVDLVI